MAYIKKDGPCKQEPSFVWVVIKIELQHDVDNLLRNVNHLLRCFSIEPFLG